MHWPVSHSHQKAELIILYITTLTYYHFCLGSVPFKIERERLYLHRHSSFNLSGLYEKRASNRMHVVTSDNAYWELPEEDVKIAMRESPVAIVLDKGIELDKVEPLLLIFRNHSCKLR